MRSLKISHPLLSLCGTLLLMTSQVGLAAPSDFFDDRQVFAQGVQYFQQGAFDKAATAWRQVADKTESPNSALRVRAYLGVAVACQKMGLYQEALQGLAEAQSLLPEVGDATLEAQYRQQLGNLYLATHRHTESIESLAAAVKIAKQTNRQDLQAAILNDYGNALHVGGYVSDARAAHQAALTLARELQATRLAYQAALNIARLELKRGETDAAREALRDSLAMRNAIPPSYEWAMALFTAVDLERALPTATADAGVRVRMEDLQKVLDYATTIRNSRLLSMSHGYIGKEALALGNLSEAEASLRSAVLHAAQSQAPDILYEWYWRLALVLRRQDKVDAAIAAFEQSLAVLAPIRAELLNGYHDSHDFFQAHIRPVYLDFADVLLARADTAEGDAERRALDRARTAVEALKSAELQDYFRDECVATQERKSMTLAQVSPTSAVLYPIVLAGRVELLLSINGELSKRSIAVDQNQLLENTLRLREFVQDSSNARFLPYANRLYRWLIEPVKQQLVGAGIDTLVVIPDGVLRTVPFAALHSGERFLVEEFALAVTPSLALTTGASTLTTQGSALLAGVAQAVQGFSPLPKVTAELSSIHDQMGGKVLSNGEYTIANLSAALAADDYSIVHMATHSTIGATPAESFLLTYDGKLTMGDLEFLLRIGEFRKQPLELLTLSACETAVGDERAALGLAGMAVKSGAKSVLASLWLVDDSATAALMNRFYRNLDLRGGNSSKAKALRAAQLNLLAEPATEHPANWAAFMLIGNWQ